MISRANDLDLVICPTCGSAKNTQIGQTATAFESLAGGKVFRQPTYGIRYCDVCGLYFKSHTLALEELDDYYSRLECESFEFDGNFPTDRILHRELERLPNGCKVLDFGCSTGRVLKNYTGRFTCVGVEVSETAAAIARDRGIRVVSKDDLRTGAMRDFDAILLTDVYEHLVQPVELVTFLATLLKPGGWLALVTGNGDAIRTRDRISEFWYFRLPGHLQMLSDRHVDWLATKLELELEGLHHCSHYGWQLTAWLRQYTQSFAYFQFWRARRGRMARFLRLIPFLNRAERWPNAPALTYTADHVVAIFRKNPVCKTS